MDIENISKAGSLYKGIFELSPDSIVTLDTKGFITSINPAGAKMVGYTVNELTGSHFTKMGCMNIRDVPKYVGMFTATISGKEVKPLEINLTRKDGTPINVEVRIGLLKENGKITGIQAITRDITESKKAEDTLRKSENIYRTLLDNIPQKIFLKDKNSVYISCNENYAQDLKIDREEIKGKTDYDFYQKELAEKYRTDDKKTMESGKTEDIEEKYIQNGNECYVHTVKTPVRDEQGNVYGVLGIFWDITERKKAEDKLRIKDWAIESSANAIVNSDIEGILTYVNPAFLKLWGYSSPAEVLGKPAVGFWQMGEKAAEAMEAVRTKGAWSGELVAQRKDGTLFYVYVTSSMIVNDAGQPVCMQASFSDITERKKAEEKLHETNEYLDNLFNYANAPIIVWDTQYKITRFNHAFESLTGRAAGDVIGRSLKILFPPINTSASMELIKKTTRGEKWNIVEIPILNVNGSIRTVLWNSAAIFSPDGKTPIAAIAQGQDITERKEAEEILRESEEKFKALLDSAPDAFFIYDGKGMFIDGNKAAEKLSGYKKDELIGKSFLKVNLLPPDQLIKGIADLAKNAMGIRTEAREYTLNRKDGTKVICEINSSPIKIKGRTYILGVARDLTERKKAEEKIKESEARYGLIFNSATDLLVQMDMAGTIVDVNKQVFEVGGYERNEIVGKKATSLARIFTVQSLALIAFNFAKVLAGQELKPYEVQAKNKAGQAIFFDVSSAIMRDGSGKAIGIVAILHDITERKNAERSLRESEEKFKAIFDNANDGFILASLKDKKLVIGNKAICKMTGYTLEEIKTLVVMDFIPEKDLTYSVDQFEKQARGEIKTAENMSIKRKDGSVFYADIDASPITVSGENYQMGVFRDITERKNAEILKDELLHKVEEANRNKTEYVSGVSHELRTPLASIKGFVSTIRSDKEMDEATRADFLRIIEEETDRLTRIIEDLLDISRIESGRLKLSLRSFNIMDLITKNVENLKPLAGSKGIVIQSRPAQAPYIVYADQDKTTQIITNLLSNAIKYNKQGGNVSIAASEDDGKVRVDIEDTGIGISEKDLTHMFEKFFRAEGSSSETPGTGLGLAVTKSLVQVMGGEISVNSKPGEGSRFSFSLPKFAGDQKEKTNERA